MDNTEQCTAQSLVALSPRPPAAGSPHLGEQRGSERSAASDVQHRGQGRIDSGQDADRVGAFILKGVTGGVDEITGRDMAEYRKPRAQEEHGHHEYEIHGRALAVPLLGGRLLLQLEPGYDEQPDIQPYHDNHRDYVPHERADARDLFGHPDRDQVVHGHDQESVDPVDGDDQQGPVSGHALRVFKRGHHGVVPVRLRGQDGHERQPQKRGHDVKGSVGGVEAVPHVEHADIIIGHAGADVAEAGAQHVHEAVLAAHRPAQQYGEGHRHVEEDDGRSQGNVEQNHQHIAEARGGHHQGPTLAAVAHGCMRRVHTD